MIRIANASISHHRLRPLRNRFRYSALYLDILVDALAGPSRHGLFSIGRFNLFSVRENDYADGITPAAQWIRRVLADWQIPEADGDVRLVTMPRVLGYAFNPVSFWLCFDTAGRLRAVLAEVNNTFGERHSYVCFHEDRRPIAPDDMLRARKIFHVSPFMRTEGEYAFRFSASDGRIAVAIDLADREGVLLRTSLTGEMVPLTSLSLLRTLARNPLHPFKIIALIHYQAAKLFLKGLRPIRKGAPPAALISR